MEGDLGGRLAGGLEKSHHQPLVGIGGVFGGRLVEEGWPQEKAGEVEILWFARQQGREQPGRIEGSRQHCWIVGDSTEGPCRGEIQRIGEMAGQSQVSEDHSAFSVEEWATDLLPSWLEDLIELNGMGRDIHLSLSRALFWGA